MLTMQDALIVLTQYWASRGCVIAQPMNTEVGAGTLNPATALRVLGPEPWRVAYVEPSVRPDDSRYGDNPNRMQMYDQFQVILKPEPGDAQELYLQSLEALGIDIRRHDVRFVEDNWASPALGAWGLGWEVWLDGLEITQFTYFQQSGGMNLEPVSCEITYGVERIMMALQGVSHFKDITYAPGVSYGEAFGQAEYEMSRYYLDDADIATNWTLFESYEAEARRLLDARLPVPAHSYVLKCSHAFNVLDARGAISTTERARAFARMRSLTQAVARLWVERREELGFPLGAGGSVALEPSAAPGYPELPAPAPLAFEIGVEEMPADETTRTAEAVEAALRTRLGASRLAHGAIRVVATPRRVVATVDDVQPREADHEETIRGPRASAAYTPDGSPTRAASGFARSRGVAVDELRRLEVDGEAYVGVVRHVPGRPASEVLAGILREVVLGLRSERNMRWNAPGLAFCRPIRWLVALLGEEVVPFTVANLQSGRTTRVHRTADVPEVAVASARGYVDCLRSQGIVADPEERRALIVEASSQLAGSVGGRIDPNGETAVVDEITNLVEDPNAILGSFDERYLDLPTDVLTTVMKKHQRYLPVRRADGRLLPHFVAVANGACDRDLVRAGNEAVLRARYEDAAFFWRKDLETPPERMKRELDKLTFADRLGTMADRAERIARIADGLRELVDLSEPEAVTLARAGQLAKFDLGSQMVAELSSLAGTMAREYARRAGEDDAVAEALFEMELPRHAGDAIPSTAPGALLALADRFDLLVGLFATGSAPTGSSDPFGLRRAALGIIATLGANPRLVAITLDRGIALASAMQPITVSEEARADAYQFTLRRLEQHLIEHGHAVEVVRAVLPRAASPVRAEQTAAELGRLRDNRPFQEVATAVQRVLRIVPPGTPPRYDPALFEMPAEHRLDEAIRAVGGGLDDPALTLSRFVELAATLVEPIDLFFVDVLVMARDPAVRANRLGLLACVGDRASRMLDWEALRG